MRHLADKEIFNILNDLEIENFTINEDGSVDVDGDVNLSGRGLTEIPVQFGHVTGYFTCYQNKLTSLVGSPTYVGESFSCAYNNLTSLEGGPNHVGGNFYCHDNRLVSLIGSPKYVGGNFDCSFNQLITLVGSPTRVGINFYCRSNQLTSLIGAPAEVFGGFIYFRNNSLPKEIMDNYDHIKYILQYQDMYNIWRSDGSLDKFRFQEMMKDIDI